MFVRVWFGRFAAEPCLVSERSTMVLSRTVLTFALCALLPLGCNEPQDGRIVLRTDAAILRAEIRDDWQEGPTDGTVCVDPRVLRNAAPGDTVTMTWAPDVLSALQADTLISIDTTVGPIYTPDARTCAPRRGKPSIRMGVPSVRGDSSDLSVYASWPASPNDAGWRFPMTSVLARRGGQWALARHPGQEFPVLPDAR